MTDSAVLDTILRLIFLCNALALLCGGLVEMIANWVKRRASTCCAESGICFGSDRYATPGAH
jgi:hypothetical protein